MKELRADERARKIFVTFPEGKKKAFTMSYDDGDDSDIRLVETMRRYGVRGTFHINSNLCPPEPLEHKADTWERLTMQECLDLYGEDMEISVHGANHTYWNKLPSPQAMLDIMDDRRALEALFNRQIRGMAYPFGRTNDTVMDVLKLCGVYYSRTVVSTEKFEIPSTEREWLKLPATCHHKNPRLMELCDQFLSSENRLPPPMFYLWGHSYEFDNNDNWNVIEEFCEYIGGRDDIWYATNIEIYDYVKAYEALEVSLDKTIIHNPSAIDVWFAKRNGETYCVRAGETLRI